MTLVFAILILLYALMNLMSFFLYPIYVKLIINVKEEIVGCWDYQTSCNIQTLK